MIEKEEPYIFNPHEEKDNLDNGDPEDELVIYGKRWISKKTLGNKKYISANKDFDT